MSGLRDNDLVDFGAIADTVNDILQEGVALYRRDAVAAEARFRVALDQDPTALPVYLCLYKIHTYGGRLDEALAVAHAGLAEAARQCGLAGDWRVWERGGWCEEADGPGRFALYTLKALAFIHLRRGEPEACGGYLAKLEALGQAEGIGGVVVAELARGLEPVAMTA